MARQSSNRLKLVNRSINSRDDGLTIRKKYYSPNAEANAVDLLMCFEEIVFREVLKKSEILSRKHVLAFFLIRW